MSLTAISAESQESFRHGEFSFETFTGDTCFAIKSTLLTPANKYPPKVITNDFRLEMFGTHNSIERWRRAFTRVLAMNEFAQPAHDSSILVLQEQNDPYELNPPFVEPERLRSPIHEIRGEPELQLLME
jgi:hypothetical protein